MDRQWGRRVARAAAWFDLRRTWKSAARCASHPSPGCDQGAIGQQACPTGAATRLHLGCGENYLEGYANIDFPPAEHTIQQRSRADRFADIRTLQYPSGSVDEIRLHHVFEHFDRAEALDLLIRWRTWLKVGGVLTIETPDFERCVRMWLKSKDRAARFRIVRHLFGSQEAPWAAHRDGWWLSKFQHVLSSLGFADIRARHGQWQGTYNITVTASKDRSLRTLEAQLELKRRLLSLSLVDDSDTERRMLAVWLGSSGLFQRAG